MNEQQLEKALNILSEKLEKPIEIIWRIAVNGQRLEGILGLFMIVAYLMLMYRAYKILRQRISDDGELVILMMIVALIALILSSILFKTLLAILMPEWCIIKAILS